MKKRIIITLFILLGLSAIPLMIGIFYLYSEAEKVQRSIFVNEVLSAGNEVIDRIDAIIKNDSTTLIAMDSDRKSTRLNSSHTTRSRMPSSA